MRIAIRNLWSKKSRTALAMLGLLLGVATIISLISITDGIRSEVGGIISEVTGITVMEKDIFSPTLSHIPIDRVAEIEQIFGVESASERIMVMVTTFDEVGGGLEAWAEPIMIFGIDPRKEQLSAKGKLPTGENVVRGRAPLSGEKFVAVIDTNTADDFNKVIGSNLKLSGKTFKVIGLYESEVSIGGVKRVLSTIDAAREIADDLPSDMVNAIYVEANNPRDNEKIAQIIEFRYDDLEARTGEEILEQVSSILGSVDAFLWVISIIATVVAGLGIINTMLMSVRERYREFGVLRAVGWTKDEVLALVMHESLLLGVGGGIVGILFGFVLVQIAKGYIAIPMRVTLWTALLAFMFAIFVGIIGGAYPAWKAANLDPLEAIRSED